mmetsp:Transcript_33259/g.75132  ORF Transcript_33259/g.75132 Transcript_33259/m.75132 type:complete len:207 (+) Transcript_33259:1463-2083(+)
MYRVVGHEMGPVYRCFSRKVMHANWSPWLYSYGMHHPSAPNLRRSWTTECRKHRHMSSLRHMIPSALPSIRSSLSWSTMSVYDRTMPALRPEGGSLVTLVDIWRRPRGKSLSGRAESQRRKPGWVVSLSLSRSSSISIMSPMPSSQFSSITQVPFSTPASMARWPTISIPSPMETHGGSGTLSFLAMPSTPSVGLDPLESRNRVGV